MSQEIPDSAWRDDLDRPMSLKDRRRRVRVRLAILEEFCALNTTLPTAAARVEKLEALFGSYSDAPWSQDSWSESDNWAVWKAAVAIDRRREMPLVELIDCINGRARILGILPKASCLKIQPE